MDKKNSNKKEAEMEKKTYLRLLNEERPEIELFRKDRNAWLKEMKKRERMTLVDLIKTYKLKKEV